MSLENVIKYFVRVMIIFLILPIHEYAHAWAAHKQGDDTALHQGRLTLNPLVHIDIIGAALLFFTGFGWAKPVQFNPLRFKKQRKGIALTALAGPLSNLIVAFIGVIVYQILIGTGVVGNLLKQYILEDNKMYILIVALNYFILINIGLALFNLIPVPPLDGAKILSYFTSYNFERKIAQYEQFIAIAFLALMFTGILSKPLQLLTDLIFDFMTLITNWIPKLLM